jgi:2-oxoglutarate dehydrogenase E2 component (dihydrolipoamide succinyltransferase)
MSIELKVPSLGESVQQATIGAWLKKEGEAVALDEPIVEVESEKATVAVPAPAAGVLRRMLKQTGDTVNVGEVIGELEAGAAAQAVAPVAAAASKKGGDAKPAAPAPSPTAAVAPPPPAAAAATPGYGSARNGPTAGATAGPTAPTGAHGEGRKLRAPPSARRLMAEHGLEASAVAGPSGQVRKEDVLRALQPAPAAPAPSAPKAPQPPAVAGDRERVVPMTALRKTVARRLVEAQHNAAILTTFNEVDMSRVLAMRERHGPAFLEKHGIKLGFMSFFVRAAVEALRAFPMVNAELRGDAIVYKDHYDVGVAVGGGKGLVVPVVRDADLMSFAEIELGIADLAKKAKENRITMDDLAGGTFTISNGGIYGSLLSTPILNPPQSGILGLHKIEKRAKVIEGDQGDQIMVRPMMYLALSYDHRLIDGREAVSFLVKVKEGIEDPERLLLEI